MVPATVPVLSFDCSLHLFLPEAAVLTNGQVKVGERLIKARSPTVREASGHLPMDLFFVWERVPGMGEEQLEWMLIALQ